MLYHLGFSDCHTRIAGECDENMVKERLNMKPVDSLLNREDWNTSSKDPFNAPFFPIDPEGNLRARPLSCSFSVKTDAGRLL